MYQPYRRGPRGRFWLFPFIILILLLLLGGVVMWLWNWIVTPVAGLGKLTYGQGIGLLVLCRLLFGSWRRGGPPAHSGAPWRTKWMQMNEEERAKFKEEWKRRCGPPPKKNEDTNNM